MSDDLPSLFVRREPWMVQAACRGLSELMFAERGDNATVRAAKDVCRACPVLAACAEWALWSGQSIDYGIAGAMTPTERKQRRGVIRRQWQIHLGVRQVDEIRARYAAGGISQGKLAIEYHVPLWRIQAAVTGISTPSGTGRRLTLTAEQVEAMQARHAESGLSYEALAAEFGVSASTIRRAVRRAG